MSSNECLRNMNRLCAVCKTSVRKKSQQQKKISTINELHVIHMINNKNVAKLGDLLCNKCRIKVSKELSSQNKYIESNELLESSETLSSQSTTNSDSSLVDPSFKPSCNAESKYIEYLELQINRVISTHKYCFLCDSSKINKIVQVPFEARLQTFNRRRLFIPNGNRCCQEHLIKNRFYDNELDRMQVYSTKSMIEVSEMIKLLTNVSIAADKTLFDKLSDYNIPEDRLKIFTGLSWENLIKLRSQLTSMRDSSMRSVTQALIIFLFKMRTGQSNAVIASIFEIEHVQQVSWMKKSVLQSFEKDVLPNHFGLQNTCREDLIKNHTSNMARKLYDVNNQLILICDGTYIRHEKSFNNEYQRKSFSGQKKVPLCKPFTICTTDGYIVDMLGPYLANVNDAQILKLILNTSKDLNDLLEENDIFLLDRGFRDIKQDLKDKKYVVFMPAFKGIKSQLSTEESNYTRLVTKLRWVVEAVHGIIKKKYRLLDKKLDNKMLPDAGSYCRIACHINNMFGKSLDSDVGMDEEILNIMKTRSSTENTLAIKVEEKRWSRRKILFKHITSSELLDFPELTQRDLQILFTGSYQLKQTISYLAEKLGNNNELKLAYCLETKNIIRVDIQSRHVNKNTYKTYIEYVSNGIGSSSILRYCCSCPNGNRTVGCCVHVATVIFYLSHGRYLGKILQPAQILSKLFLADNIAVSLNEESDDE